MKRPKRVLRFLALSVIFFSIIQAQNSRANEKKSARTKSKVCSTDLSSSRRIRKIRNCTAAYLRNAPVGTRVSTTVQANDGTTRVGAIFERVKLGNFEETWKQISANGTFKELIWSERIGNFSNNRSSGEKSQAEKECEDRGGKLPSMHDFKSLLAGFDLRTNGLLSEQGKVEFNKLFPDMGRNKFWTSSHYSSTGAYYFSGWCGYIEGWFSGNPYSVRCVD